MRGVNGVLCLVFLETFSDPESSGLREPLLD